MLQSMALLKYQEQYLDRMQTTAVSMVMNYLE